MTYVEKWTQGKPRLTALFVPQIASFAREIPEIIKFQKKHRLLTHTFQVPHFPSWYSFYRSRTLYLQPFMQMIVEGSPFAQQLLGISFTMFDLSHHPEKLANLTDTPESRKEGEQFLDDLIRMSFADIQENFDNTPLTPEVRPTVQHYKDNHEPELAFLFLVALPCWLFYREWPTSLYRKACQGDANEIHKLLRLDPFLL